MFRDRESVREPCDGPEVTGGNPTAGRRLSQAAPRVHSARSRRRSSGGLLRVSWDAGSSRLCACRAASTKALRACLLRPIIIVAAFRKLPTQWLESSLSLTYQYPVVGMKQCDAEQGAAQCNHPEDLEQGASLLCRVGSTVGTPCHLCGRDGGGFASLMMTRLALSVTSRQITSTGSRRCVPRGASPPSLRAVRALAAGCSQQLSLIRAVVAQQHLQPRSFGSTRLFTV
jgi:hypothetical protein